MAKRGGHLSPIFISCSEICASCLRAETTSVSSSCVLYKQQCFNCLNLGYKLYREWDSKRRVGLSRTGRTAWGQPPPAPQPKQALLINFWAVCYFTQWFIFTAKQPDPFFLQCLSAARALKVVRAGTPHKTSTICNWEMEVAKYPNGSSGAVIT